MERRVLLAIFLAFIVLYTWQALFVKPVPKTAPKTPGATSSAPVGSGTSTTAGPSTPSNASSAVAAVPPPATAASTAAPVVSETEERDVRVETRDVIAVFTNRGARLKSWRLKHFLDVNHEPLELVATELAATQPLPFSLRTADDRLTSRLNSSLYAVSGAPGPGVIGAP